MYSNRKANIGYLMTLVDEDGNDMDMSLKCNKKRRKGYIVQ